jgi:hypothetical protein
MFVKTEPTPTPKPDFAPDKEFSPNQEFNPPTPKQFPPKPEKTTVVPTPTKK